MNPIQTILHVGLLLMLSVPAIIGLAGLSAALRRGLKRRPRLF